MDGRAYSGKQGTQFATVLGQSQAIDLYAQLGLTGLKQRATERGEAFKSMLDAKPSEVWHYYSAEANERFNQWMRKGADIITRNGIDNPWKSAHPEAVEWQIEGAKLKAAVDNINQAKGLYEKAVGDIAVRGKEYSDAYITGVGAFPMTNNFDKLASGQFDFPTAVFKEPDKLFSNFIVKQTENIKQITPAGSVPDDDVFKQTTRLYFASEENEADVRVAKQMYENLPKATREEYTSMAELNGFDTPWQAMMYQNLKNRYQMPKLDLVADAVKYAEDAPKNYSRYTNEDMSGVTGTTMTEKLSNSRYPSQVALGYLGKNEFVLDDADAMQALGIQMDIPRTERRKQFIDKFSKLVKDNITSKVESSTTRESGGPGDKETKVSFDRWRIDLGSPDKDVANQAANFLFKTKTAEGEQISRAEVIEFANLPAQLTMQFGFPAGGGKALRIEFKDEKTANAARERYYKEIMLGMDATATEEQKQAYEALKGHLKELQRGSNTVVIPVMPENEQILKRLHDESAKGGKALYERVEMNKFPLGQPGTFDPAGIL